jgi:hypothetical protein
LTPGTLVVVTTVRNTLLPALVGALVGIGVLATLDHVDPWSWIVAPVVLALGAVAQVRALFAPGGPFRT